MDDGNSWIGILLLGAAFVVYYLIYGFGAAVQALNTSALEDERDEGNKKAESLLHIQENPHRFVRTNQLITMMFSLGMGAVSMPHVAGACENLLAKIPNVPAVVLSAASDVLALVVLSLVLVCFGIIIPKWLALKSPIRFCYKVLPMMDLFMKICFPFTALMEWVSHMILIIVGIDTRAKDDKVTEEDIMYMVNEGHDQGVLEASEAEMITNIFEFDDKVASDIMTHRMNIVALDGTVTLKDAMDFIIKDSINSRLPVYGEDIDDIIGILHLRDVLYFAEIPELLKQPIGEIGGLLREPNLVPEHKNINALFKEMQSSKIHMSIVIDEYGQTAGLVTMEDILEEIVGNIMDEYDEEEEDIVSADNNTFQLAGTSLLVDLEDTLGIEFEEQDKENFDTLNGFLTSRLGHLPKENEQTEIPFGGFVFSIVKVENRTIKLVDAKRITQQKPEDQK
ncbi:MAG: HlyC/CorC family transporter [Lachnospiraceae bacterium]|nr:HlyC/CorC family transporter [Lachnospiraceae bacterium]